MTAPSREIRAFAAAIREALEVPVADSTQPGAALAEEMLRLRRAAQVQGALGSLAAGAITVRAATVTIRETTAESPITYSVHRRVEEAS